MRRVGIKDTPEGNERRRLQRSEAGVPEQRRAIQQFVYLFLPISHIVHGKKGEQELRARFGLGSKDFQFSFEVLVERGHR